MFFDKRHYFFEYILMFIHQFTLNETIRVNSGLI